VIVMANRLPNPRLVKMHRSYLVNEVAELFGCHRNTVRNWQKAGLQAVDARRPALFKGSVLREFLESRRAAARSPCKPGEMYCFGCRAPRAPKTGSLAFLPSQTGAGNLLAQCAACGAKMYRRTRESDLARLFPVVHEALQQAERRLSSRCNTPVNCFIDQGETEHVQAQP
jgi:hypothetical protein